MATDRTKHIQQHSYKRIYPEDGRIIIIKFVKSEDNDADVNTNNYRQHNFLMTFNLDSYVETPEQGMSQFDRKDVNR